MDSIPINWQMLGHPINWATVFLMVFMFTIAVHMVNSWVHPSASDNVQ